MLLALLLGSLLGPASPGQDVQGEAQASAAFAPPKTSTIWGKSVQMPMREVFGLPALAANLRGSREYLMVVDWGANLMVVSKEVAERHRFPSAGELVGKPLVRVDFFGLAAAARFEGLTALVEDWFDDMKNFDGVLGLNVFSEVLVTLDYPRKLIRLRKDSLPQANGSDILGFHRETPGTLMIDVTVQGKPLKAVVDTGLASWLTIPKGMASQFDFSQGPVEGPDTEGPNIGVMKTQLARIDGDLVMGRYRVRNPVVLLTDDEFVMTGSSLLRNFAVTLDLKGGRMRFERESDLPIQVPAEPRLEKPIPGADSR